MKMKRALVTGITGQDGSYLAELLLSKGYVVYGLRRATNGQSMVNVDHIQGEIEWLIGDLTDPCSLTEAVTQANPDEVYNLAAQSSVADSWKHPSFTGNINAMSVANLLECIRRVKPDARFFQASSSDMFGNASDVPQRETTDFHPKSPYAVAKLYGHWMTVYYRERYNMYACSGILFNHESPRRSIKFVTRKITNAVARIKLGLQEKLPMGHLDAKRDWGFAGDYVEVMWRMLQQSSPEDYVVATGQSHSVRRLLEVAFEHAGLDYRDYVCNASASMRPAEISALIGNPSKAHAQLGWKAGVSFPDLIGMMVDADLASIQGLPSCIHRDCVAT